MVAYGQCSGIVFETKSKYGRPCIKEAVHRLSDGTVYCSDCHRDYVRARNWAAQGHKVKPYKPRKHRR